MMFYIVLVVDAANISLSSQWIRIMLFVYHLAKFPRQYTSFYRTSVCIRYVLLGCVLLFLIQGCQSHKVTLQPLTGYTFSVPQLTHDLRYLSSEAMQGRKPLTKGSELAQRYLIERFSAIGLQAFPAIQTSSGFMSPFSCYGGARQCGTNIIGFLPKTTSPQSSKLQSLTPQSTLLASTTTDAAAPVALLVITAHYDHLGKQRSQVYYGADDNASGVSGMLALASALAQLDTRHVDVLFVATDAEEKGLFGAKALVRQLQKIGFTPKNTMSINLDMIGNGGVKQRLYIAADRHTPWLQPFVHRAIERSNDHQTLNLVRGHEGRSYSAVTGDMDWRVASDHAPFRRAGYVYAYFGVDEHRRYHTPSDTFESIPLVFFANGVEAIIAFTRDLVS